MTSPEDKETCDGDSHILDKNIKYAYSMDNGTIVIDVWCVRCGLSGSVAISSEDISWE